MGKLNIDRDTFRVVFRAVYTLMVSIWVGMYLWQVTFSPADKISKFAEFIIGFVLGTLISTLINFYFGGTENATRKAIPPADVVDLNIDALNSVLQPEHKIADGDDTQGKVNLDA